MRRTSSLLMAATFWVPTAFAQTPDPNGTLFPPRASLSPGTQRPQQLPHNNGNPASSTTPMPRPDAPPVVLDEEFSHFDDRMAELQWNGGRWQLWSGAQLLKDFGRHEADGRLALTVIREMHLTQRGTIGSPRPIMEYWLSDGRAPTESVPGLRTIPIDRTTLRTESVQGYWYVRDDRNTFFNFGGHKEEADRALAIMRRRTFDRVGLIGQGTPKMLVFLASSPGIPGTPLHAPPSPRGRIMTAQGMQNVERPVGELQPSMMQKSNLYSNPSPSGQSGQMTDARTRPNTQPSSDLAGAAMSFNRQLAPASPRSVDLKMLADRIPLDYHQTRLSRDAEGWKLLCGNYVVATFGPDEREAKLADMAFRTGRFTEQCVIGHPKPAFSYFLVNGKPPRELPLAAQTVAFRPDDLSIRQANGEYAICDLSRPLFHFGTRAEEAKEALKAIQNYRFDSFCRLGFGEQGMLILARTQ